MERESERYQQEKSPVPTQVDVQEPHSVFEHAWVYVPGENGPEYIEAGPDLVEEFFAKPIDTDNTVAYMNVGEVIDPNLASEVTLGVQSKYGPRAFALMTRQGKSIVGADTPEDFIKYQEALRGYAIEIMPVPFTNPNVTSAIPYLGSELKGKRVKPYMAHPRLLQETKKVGADLDGWNTESTRTQKKLNDKYKFAEWVRNKITHAKLLAAGIATERASAAPYAIETTQEKLLGVTIKRLHEINNLYQRHEENIIQYHQDRGVDYEPHEAAVIIRPSWGGGSYETFKVAITGTREVEGETVEIYSLGHEGAKYEDLMWSEIEKNIKSQFAKNGASEKYTITRFIDKVEDPGINAVILVDEKDPTKKHIYIAPTHGQVSEGTMCVGTQSDNSLPGKSRGKRYYDGSSVDDPTARQQQHNLSRHATAFVANEMALNASSDLILGVDVMDAAFWEAALAASVTGTEEEFESVGPKVYAETNLRLTQRTMHQLTQEAIINKVEGRAFEPVTYKQLIAGYEQTGTRRHFTSLDSQPVTRAGWQKLMATTQENHKGKNILAGFNGEAKAGKAQGVYVIMPPVKWSSDGHSTMGIGIIAESQKKVEDLLAELIDIANGFDNEQTTAVDNL